MMERVKNFLGYLYSTEQYRSLVDKDRARILYSVNTLLLILSITLAVVGRDAGTGETYLEQALQNPVFGFAFAAVITLAVSSVALVRLGALRLASLALVLNWTFSFGVAAASAGLFGPTAGVILVIQVLLGGLFLGRAGLVLSLGLAAVLYALGLIARADLTPPTYATGYASEAFIVFFLLVLFSGVVYLFLRFSRLSREEGLEIALAERLALAELTAQITRSISSRTDFQDVMNSTVEQIVAVYDEIYHAQIFLIDDSGLNARLVASTGEAGQKLLARQHSLGVGSQSVIGRVTGYREPVVARVGALNTVHRRNEFLPDTMVEAAFRS
jgi:hypothetical protein